MLMKQSLIFLFASCLVAFGETDFAHNPSAGNRGFVKLYDQS